MDQEQAPVETEFQVPPTFVHPERSKSDKSKKLVIIWGVFAIVVNLLYVLAGYVADWNWTVGTMYLTVFFFCLVPSIFILAYAVQGTRIILSTNYEWKYIIQHVFSTTRRSQSIDADTVNSMQAFNDDPYYPGSNAWHQFGAGAIPPESAKHP